jgi:taurine dioxygenase
MTFTVRPLASHIGAEIGGLDISQPLGSDTIDELRSTLREWRVMFFRDQELDHASHVAFARQFGDPTYAHPHEDAPPDGYPEVYAVDETRRQKQYGTDARSMVYPEHPYAEGWHSDVTPAVNPPSASILRAGVVPGYGGDTTFTNLVAAYESLSEPVRAFLDGLRAEHFYGAGSSGRMVNREKYENDRLVTHHPVVRVHPHTGEKALFVNPVFTHHIIGVSPIESRWILDFLFSHLTRTEFTVRFKWEPGSVAFWDERVTAHLGPQDLRHRDVERVLYRVTLIGEVPVGPDGRESELIEGMPFRSAPVFGAAT